MIWVDPPTWPAHKTVFGHLVSDSSLGELHAFARRVALPAGAFDHDHYDVPARRYDDLLDAGAHLVGAKELLQRLVASGLRVRPTQKQPDRAASVRLVRRHWEAAPPAPDGVRDDLLSRWGEPHRRYHDVRHLAQVLGALDALGNDDPLVTLAAWFHDAVYAGRAGDDEEASAELARSTLGPHLGAEAVAEVGRLVALTATHAPAPGDTRGALLADADLSILAVSEARYHVYARDVRVEYAHVGEAAFVAGRAGVLRRLLALEPLFRRAHAWADAARANLTAELAHLEASGRPLVG